MFCLFKSKNGKPIQVLIFMDNIVILHEDNSVKTDSYCKRNNGHEFLPHQTSHPNHAKNNISL